MALNRQQVNLDQQTPVNHPQPLHGQMPKDAAEAAPCHHSNRPGWVKAGAQLQATTGAAQTLTWPAWWPPNNAAEQGCSPGISVVQKCDAGVIPMKWFEGVRPRELAPHGRLSRARLSAPVLTRGVGASTRKAAAHGVDGAGAKAVLHAEQGVMRPSFCTGCDAAMPPCAVGAAAKNPARPLANCPSPQPSRPAGQQAA